MSLLHHAAICTADIEKSLLFWREGLKFQVLMDESFEGDWPTLFGARGRTLRSVFLGDPTHLNAGLIELVVFNDLEQQSPESFHPVQGFFLFSLYAEIDDVLARMAEMEMGGTPRVITVSGARVAVIRDPNGVTVELMDSTARSNMRSMTTEPR